MLISYNWLKDYVDVKLPPGKLADLLTMSGLSVDYVKEIPGDTIINIEVTSNRPDWLSYIGVAREVAAICGRKLKIPSLVVGRSSFVKTKTVGRGRMTNDQRRTTIRIDDKALCPRYTARVITGVKIAESPAWLKTKLEAMGLKPVNNIVDITNFCLFETGEPMHAFDLDKIKGGVIVRRAKKGEKIMTIDGTGRELDGAMLVIADADRPIAVAGVMGALNTEVTASTKHMLLEAAYFDPISVRRTSRKLGIATESSYRFERRVDIDSIAGSSERALGLILELAGGAAGAFIDIGRKDAEKKTIGLRLSRLNAVLGIDMPGQKAEKILKALGLKKRQSPKGKLIFETPGFRNDLKEEVDLIEEIARTDGYDRIPSTIPVIVEQPTRLPREIVVARKIREALKGLGSNEIITYGLVGKKGAGPIGPGGVVEIKNPLTSEQEAMRPSLLYGTLGSMSWNINRRSKNLNLFELGNTYKNIGGRFSETMSLSMAVTGQTAQSWNAQARPVTFYDLKGMLEALFDSLRVKQPELKASGDERFSGSASAVIEIDGKASGVIGEVSRKILGDLDIKSKVYYLELDIGPLVALTRLVKRFEELPRYPSVSRDISIVVGKDVACGSLESSIRDSAGPALKEVKLVDRYKGEQIPPDKTGFTYRLEYEDPSRTLEEKDVSAAHSGVLEELKSRFGATLR